mmetsp:Transcript_17271/g.37260  ORF Transcript_17271/g.37260 Transcript_17271/m.37260 type:complete len:213 (+) Transcript_17271:232-870(+)
MEARAGRNGANGLRGGLPRVLEKNSISFQPCRSSRCLTVGFYLSGAASAASAAGTATATASLLFHSHCCSSRWCTVRRQRCGLGRYPTGSFLRFPEATGLSSAAVRPWRPSIDYQVGKLHPPSSPLEPSWFVPGRPRNLECQCLIHSSASCPRPHHSRTSFGCRSFAQPSSSCSSTPAYSTKSAHSCCGGGKLGWSKPKWGCHKWGIIRGAG